MRERRLTVPTLHQPRTPRSDYDPNPEYVVPYLRMRGQWLDRLGFRPGSRVRVEAERERLVLTVDPPAEGA